MTITFLVDEISPQAIIAYTTDSEKINYNFQQIPEIEKAARERIRKTKNGGTIVFPLGRFVVVYNSTIDFSNQRLFFFDYRGDFMHIHLTFPDLFTENIHGQFLKIANYFLTGEIEPDDSVTFSLSNPSSYN